MKRGIVWQSETNKLWKLRCGYGEWIHYLKPVVLKSKIIGIVFTMPNERTFGSLVISLEKLIIHCVPKLMIGRTFSNEDKPNKNNVLLVPIG